LEQVLLVLSKLVQVREPLPVVMLQVRRLELEPKLELELPLGAMSPSTLVSLLELAKPQLVPPMSVLAVST
jgi:hypothetical protein